MLTHINFRNDGNAYVNVEGERYFVFKNNTGESLPGDLVEIELSRHRKRTEAKVISVKERGSSKFVGIIEKSVSRASVKLLKSFGYEFKVFKRDFYEQWDSINNGDKVVIEFTKWKKKGKPEGKILEVLGESLDNEVEMNSIIIEYGFETKFSTEALEESEKISSLVEVTEDRVDMRNVNTLTIDPASAKDYDDALSIERNTNGYTIGVHIADVSHYVKEGSAIDKDAILRATSVYLVDRTIPMLPNKLSNGLCSLNPGEDRYAFSVMFDMAESGRIRKYWLQNSVIHSNKKYSYEEALEIIEGKDDTYQEEIQTLCSLSMILRKDRSKDNIKINRKEAQFKIDKDGKPLEIYFKEATKATQLIEEFMLLANKHVGLEHQKKGHTFIWRNHDEPNVDKLLNLELYLELIGEPYKIREDHAKQDINVVLNRLEGSYLYDTVSMLAMKSMAKAKYNSNNIGHYGLGFTTYSHFTSPIRRYPDLIAHRILKKTLDNKVYNYPDLEEKCLRCNMKEVSAQKAERDSIKYKQAEYMEQFLGEEFKGIVSYIMNKRVFVILENGIEASFSIKHNKDNTEHKAYVDGYEITIGTYVNVIIKDVDLFRKEINLEIKF